MTEQNLNELYNQAKQGDRPAEEQLFRALTARFRLFVRRRIWNGEDAEEIVQKTLMAINRDYRDMEFTASFSAWAYKVLDYRILSYIQSKRRHNERNPRLDDVSGGTEPAGPDSDPDLKRQLLDCLQLIGHANTRYARILNLKYQGYDTEEICTKLHVTPNNFYSILSRARSMLETCLETGDIR
ncbi:MAG: RNA polymerase sigma factor [candidate division Zixibacteria bacterium]|nr:RNA polymerase sigma factor [candidate division Zixibacteria bacterium]